jgi:uncharacterized membrane protein YkoI
MIHSNGGLLIGLLFSSAALLLGGPALAAEKKAAGPASIPLASLPPAVQATVHEQTKGAVIHNISKEIENGKTVYEIETKVGGRSRDMIVGADGALMVVESQVVLDSLPAPVRSTFLKSTGTGKIIVLESVTLKDSLVYYEAQIMTAGKRSEVKVDPTGHVVTDAKKK